MPDETNLNPVPVTPEAVAPAPVAPPVVAATVATPAPEPKSKPVKLYVFLVLFFVVLGIAAGAFYMMTRDVSPEPAMTQPVEMSPTPVPPTPTPAGVSDSLDMTDIQKEIDQTTPDSVDSDLQQLDSYTKQL